MCYPDGINKDVKMEIVRKRIDSKIIDAGFYTPTKSISIPIYEVSSFYLLNQFVGYAKYINRNSGNIYFRGQEILSPKMITAFFRKCTTNGSMQSKQEKLSAYLSGCEKSMPIFKDLPDYLHEPLLQHYGIKTRWLDLVDNLWVALWFGTHNWHTRQIDREYFHISSRKDKNESMYLFLMGSDATEEHEDRPGFYVGSKTYTIDLRKSAPSIFLRPHAQHAILMRQKKIEVLDDVEMSECIVGVLKIRIEDALDWIGNGGLMSPQNIFPSVNFDHGYGILIEQATHSKSYMDSFGSIYTVTY